MSAIRNAASASRASGGCAQYQPHADCLPYFDTDGTTRALVERVSDGQLHALFVSGNVSNVIAKHNERMRASYALNAARKLRADDKDVSTLTDEQSAELVERIEALETQLKSMPKTRTVATVHVSRTLDHYDALDESDVETVESDVESDESDE